MDPKGIKIYECKHNITHIGKQSTPCINRNGEILQPNIEVDLVEVSSSWLVLPHHKAQVLCHHNSWNDDSLMIKEATWGHDMSPKSNL